MKSEVHIRAATIDELDTVVKLVKRSYQEFEPLVPDYGFDAWMDSIIEAVVNWSGDLLVAEQDGKIKGTIKFYPDATHAGNWPPGSACMRILAVSPFCRGQGLGSLLVRECIRRARQHKIPAICLHTAKFMHAARHIYEKMGFRRVPEFDGKYGPIAYCLDLPLEGESPEIA
jgi:ribosomal protein S18 acetylase RimI-like enzyme